MKKIMYKKIFIVLSTACLFILPIFAREIFESGEYVTAGGWGHLAITKNNDQVKFTISTVGANGHTCSLEGVLQNGKATLDGTDKQCIVTFRLDGDRIEVTSSGMECQYYCGVRASFDGMYLKPAQGCDAESRNHARSEFKRLYDKKEYRKALARLKPILETCATTLDWLEKGWIQNDIAITQYKLANFMECRHVLAPLKADTEKTDEEILEEYPPADGENYLPIIKAARTNLKLCDRK